MAGVVTRNLFQLRPLASLDGPVWTLGSMLDAEHQTQPPVSQPCWPRISNCSQAWGATQPAAEGTLRLKVSLLLFFLVQGNRNRQDVQSAKAYLLHAPIGTSLLIDLLQPLGDGDWPPDVLLPIPTAMRQSRIIPQSPDGMQAKFCFIPKIFPPSSPATKFARILLSTVRVTIHRRDAREGAARQS